MAEEKEDKQKGIRSQEGNRTGPKAVRGKSWFFGIGINHYQEFSTLNNAVKDVEDIRTLLLNQYDISADCTRILTNEAATREGIIDELDQLVEEVGKWDKLIIYYSGHGHLDKKTDLGFWIPHDAKKGRTAKYIRNSTIRDYVKVINAHHTLLISDACFSGALFVRGTQRSEVVMEELEERISRWAICSGRHDEEVYDGEPGQNSPFADSILDILGNNQKPKINVAKLADRIVELTRSNYHQLPEGNPLYGVGHKGGQYIFRLKESETEDWKTCQVVGTLSAYRFFLGKYPNSKFAAEANKKKVFLEEEEAWEKIQAATEKDEWEITHKIMLLHDYVSVFDSSDNYEEALEQGENLEHKRDFFRARGSLFKMRRFARKKTPFQQEAQLLIAEIEKREQEARKDMDVEREKDRQQQQEAEKRIEIVKPQKSELIKPPGIITERDSSFDTFTDPRDGQQYKTVALNGQTWLAQNLNFEVKDSWWYKDDPKNGEKYGRLYTWAAAKKACPPGWRLPTDEEWKSLAQAYGVYYDSSSKENIGDPKKAYQALIQGGSSGFQAVLGGWRYSVGGCFSLGSNGNYWSSTEGDADSAWFYLFGNGKLRRSSLIKSIGQSCRCLKD